MDLSPLKISIKVAVIATVITFITGILAAKWVVSLKKGKALMDGIFSLPLVLPPTVVGFFLLLLFGNNGLIGKYLKEWNMSVVFTWAGAVIASAVVSFPMMYRTARGAFEQVDKNVLDAARTLGKTESWIFARLMIPMSKPGILAGVVLSFARALGEFGATIMLAGNIPGKTQTMSVAVYTAMQSNNRALAYRWTLIIMGISFVAMFLMNYFQTKENK